jgi:hypothetical protein
MNKQYLYLLVPNTNKYFWVIFTQIVDQCAQAHRTGQFDSHCEYTVQICKLTATLSCGIIHLIKTLYLWITSAYMTSLEKSRVCYVLVQSTY